MEQLTQDKIYVKGNNKAKIGFILGLISLLAWISTLASFSLGGGTAVTFGLLVIFAIVAVIGIICSIVGFKAHKVKAIFGIIFCLLGIYPLIVVVQLQRQIGEVGNTTYKEADFSIEIPSGWVKLNTDSKAEESGIRLVFAPKQNNEVYRARISVASLKIKEANDLNTFVQGEEMAIKGEYNFISGKEILASRTNPSYEIDYRFDNKGNTIRGREILTVKNGVGYIVTTESLESSWTKYLPQFTKTILSFDIF